MTCTFHANGNQSRTLQHHITVHYSSATGRLISAKDHASVQINVGDVDAEGKFTGAFTTYALSGFVRRTGESDDSLNRLATKDGYLKR